MLGNLDHVCAQIARALQTAELQIYASIALVVILTVLLFPPRNDQI